jgi:hypothetical protein
VSPPLCAFEREETRVQLGCVFLKDGGDTCPDKLCVSEGQRRHVGDPCPAELCPLKDRCKTCPSIQCVAERQKGHASCKMGRLEHVLHFPLKKREREANHVIAQGFGRTNWCPISVVACANFFCSARKSLSHSRMPHLHHTFVAPTCEHCILF